MTKGSESRPVAQKPRSKVTTITATSTTGKISEATETYGYQEYEFNFLTFN